MGSNLKLENAKIEKLSLQRIKRCIHNREDTGVEIPVAIKNKMVANVYD
jgi:hypothetical protein